MKKLKLLLLILPTLFVSPICLAAADVNFHGTLIELTCKIGDDKPIDIDFGDEVVTDLLDGVHYIQSIPLTIKCSQSYSGDLNFTVKGVVSTIEDSALQTNVADLGIRLIKASDDSLLEVNKPYTHKDKDSVDIKVVPIKAKDAKLSGGVFSATAQLLVEPQ